MKKIITEAWVLSSGQGQNKPAQLAQELFTFADISDEELLAEPLYGCWEGNKEPRPQSKPYRYLYGAA